MGWRPGGIAVAAMGLLVAVSPLAARQDTERAVQGVGAEGSGPEPVSPVLARLPRPSWSERPVEVPALDLALAGGPADELTLGAQPDQAVEHSDAYYTRLTIHRWGSYFMLPLFAGEYVLGNELLNGSNPAGWVRPAHRVGAIALGVLFGTNTVTGVWNLAESWKEPGAARRIIHATLMLASDAGFAYTSSIAQREHDVRGDFGEFRVGGDNRRHRDFAIGSMALSTAGAVMMWLWR